MATDPEPEGDDRWPVSWEGARRDQLERWRKASPVERLEWLEQALFFAHMTGALPDEGEVEHDRPGGE